MVPMRCTAYLPSKVLSRRSHCRWGGGCIKRGIILGLQQPCGLSHTKVGTKGNAGKSQKNIDRSHGSARGHEWLHHACSQSLLLDVSNSHSQIYCCVCLHSQLFHTSLQINPRMPFPERHGLLSLMTMIFIGSCTHLTHLMGVWGQQAANMTFIWIQWWQVELHARVGMM